MKRTRTNEPQWVGAASKASELEEIGASARGARGRGPTTRVSASKDREDGKEGKGRGESGTLFWLKPGMRHQAIFVKPTRLNFYARIL